MDLTNVYLNMCNKATEIQKFWKPTVGDWIWRKYTVFGEEIDNQIWTKDKMAEITILTFKSSIDGYWSATNSEGDERIFKTPEELHKVTCIWLPCQDQVQEMFDFITGTSKDWMWTLLGAIHNFSVKSDFKEWIPTSMEQLWLDFLMQEKYRKHWNGQTWIKMLPNWIKRLPNA
jgi:hypothetical protein